MDVDQASQESSLPIVNEDIYQTQEQGSSQQSPSFDLLRTLPQKNRRRSIVPRKIPLSDEENIEEEQPRKRVAKRKRTQTDSTTSSNKTAQREKDAAASKKSDGRSRPSPSPAKSKRARIAEDQQREYSEFRQRLLRSTVDRFCYFHSVPEFRVLHALWAFSGALCVESWLTPAYTTHLGDVVKASDFLSGKLTGE